MHSTLNLIQLDSDSNVLPILQIQCRYQSHIDGGMGYPKPNDWYNNLWLFLRPLYIGRRGNACNLFKS